tara:strand:+ start:9796 stop:10905 length:1110 start_codon:yes stop_codon:yes gene_type:complete
MNLPNIDYDALGNAEEQMTVFGEHWLEDFYDEFPAWASIIRNDENLKGIIFDWWNKHGRTMSSDGLPYTDLYDGLMNALKESEWYLTQPEKLRNALILEATDPATYEYNFNENMRYATDIVGTYFGGEFSPDFYKFLSNEALRNDWTDDRFKREIIGAARSGKWTKSAPNSGRVKQNHDDIMSYAQDMLVPVGGDAWDLAWKIAEGTRNLNDAKDFVDGLAESRYGQWIDIRGLTNRGMTMADVVAEQKDAIVETLELNPEDVHMWKIPVDDLFVDPSQSPLSPPTIPDTKGIDKGLEASNDQGVQLFSSKATKFGEVMTEEGSRTRRLRTADEARTWAKGRDRYQTTRGFRDSIRSLSGAMAQTMGTR